MEQNSERKVINLSKPSDRISSDTMFKECNYTVVDGERYIVPPEKEEIEIIVDSAIKQSDKKDVKSIITQAIINIISLVIIVIIQNSQTLDELGAYNLDNVIDFFSFASVGILGANLLRLCSKFLTLTNSSYVNLVKDIKKCMSILFGTER